MGDEKYISDFGWKVLMNDTISETFRARARVCVKTYSIYTEMCLEEIRFRGWSGFFRLTSVQWRALVNMLMNFRVALKVEIY
jgi:hypothetical protein